VPDERRLRRFKEQLTVLGVSIIFVLLAASLPLSLLREEGWRGFLTVMTLMVVVRPLSVAVSLRASTLTRGEKAFAAWVAPRGIVAASVASLFALEFGEAGLAEGPRLLALTFLTIALTVTLQGLSAAPLARLLGLDHLEPRQMVIVGAGPLGRALALAFGSRGRAVVLVDRNRLLVEEARGLGLVAIEGNALDEATLASARTEEAAALVALTANSEVNALAANLARHAFGVHEAYAAIGHPGSEGAPDLVERVGGAIAFGQPIDVRDWEYRLEHGLARTEAREAPAAWVGLRVRDLPSPGGEVAVARIRNGRVQITHPGLSWQSGDEVVVLRHGLGGESTLGVIPSTEAGPLPVTSG
jgi:Trk K+ transport system NAD-binding subunit